MESENPTQSPSISIGFPLAISLLLIFLCFMSGLLIGCLHWNKVRSLVGASSDLHDQDVEQLAPQKLSPLHQGINKNQEKSMTTVLMPGDEVPKFIAISCPCQPSLPEKLSLKVQT